MRGKIKTLYTKATRARSSVPPDPFLNREEITEHTDKKTDEETGEEIDEYTDEELDKALDEQDKNTNEDDPLSSDTSPRFTTAEKKKWTTTSAKNI